MATHRKSDQRRDDAEHFVGELGPTFPVVRSTSESTPLARYRGMADLSLTNGAATFSVQKPAVQKHFALECEVCCGVNFALPS
jgi:hypothetical protein